MFIQHCHTMEALICLNTIAFIEFAGMTKSARKKAEWMIKQQEKSETHFFHLNKWNLLQNSSGNKIQTHTNRFPFEQTKAEAIQTIYENIAKSKKKNYLQQNGTERTIDAKIIIIMSLCYNGNQSAAQRPPSLTDHNLFCNTASNFGHSRNGLVVYRKRNTINIVHASWHHPLA